MAITGNLRTMQLSELLQWLSMGQKTGTLVVRGREGEKKIYFQGGRIISSSSTIEREYLGHFLVAYGYISEEELTRAMEVQEESKILLGKILVMIGAIREEELADLIRLKASETIYDMFLWTEGAFEFIDGQIPQLPMIPISADVTGIVMEGLRRFDEWQRIKTKIQSNREIPAIVAPVTMEDIAERDRIILQAIDGLRSIDEIALATHNPEFSVARLIYELLETGAAEMVGERSEEVVAPDDLSPEDPYETVFEEARESVFEDEIGAPPPPPPVAPTAPNRDFSRFLKRADSVVQAPAVAPPGYPTPPSAPRTPDFGSSPVGFPTPPAPSGMGASAYTPAVPPPSPVGAARAEYGYSAGPSAGAASSPGPQYGSSPSRPALAIPRPDSRPVPAAPFSPMRPAEAQPRTIAPPPPPPPPPSIPYTAVPKLTKPMEELMSWQFTPNEAFIVSRINGMWDVKSIVRISPFPEGEVLRVFQKLHEGGVIAWR